MNRAGGCDLAFWESLDAAHSRRTRHELDMSGP